MSLLVRFRRLDRLYRWSWAVVDSGLWAAATLCAVWLRYDFDRVPVFESSTLGFAGASAVAHMLMGVLMGPYAVGHRRGSFEELLDIGRTATATTAVLFALAVIADPIVVPRSVPLMAGSLALGGMFALRFVVRTWRTHRAKNVHAERRAIIFGAGDAGQRLVRSMLRDPETTFLPLAFLDDDARKRRLRVDGVRVLGTRTAMTEVAERLRATTLVIALPQAQAELIRSLSESAAAAGLDVLVLPPLREIIGGRPTSRDLRDVNLEDLLGRRPITMDTALVSKQIGGRVVLVTGAGGSIGSELCRQLARFGPAKLYLLDRDESGLQETQLSLVGHGLLQGEEIVLADIRDVERMREVFAATRPQIVFHAAALKHLPLLERFPLEAWKSNVRGTLNVLTAATEAGVETFVNISTDKAADPTCILGYSKRVSERLTADFDRRHGGRYVSVRFGNVLGSRGSVVHLFMAQIERGGPVTVTHPEVERFFMLIPEACQLVLEASSIGHGGEVMVLEMGEQVKIVDVAKTLIRLSGRRDVQIDFTGLRPGEKVSEALFSSAEDGHPTSNPLMTSVASLPLAAADVVGLEPTADAEAADWLRRASLATVEA